MLSRLKSIIVKHFFKRTIYSFFLFPAFLSAGKSQLPLIGLLFYNYSNTKWKVQDIAFILVISFLLLTIFFKF